MTDLIDRQAAIDALADMHCKSDEDGYVWIVRSDAWARIDALPSAHPELDEWCTECKEYDQEKHCCPRWNRVIRTELEEAQLERKKGKWIYGEDEHGIDGYHCDKCGFFVPWDYVHKFINYIKDYHFCPNCGADIRGDDDEELHDL